MAQFRILSLEHPNVIKALDKKGNIIIKKITEMKEKRIGRSWINIENADDGRKGIYEIMFTKDKMFCILYIAIEYTIENQYYSLNNILAEYNYSVKKIPIKDIIPKTEIFNIIIDLESGLCYVFTRKRMPKFEIINSILVEFLKDIGIPYPNPKILKWSSEILDNFSYYAKNMGYRGHIGKASTGISKLRVKGPLDIDTKLQQMQYIDEPVDWNIRGFEKENKEKGNIFFGLNMHNCKDITIRGLDEESTWDEILEIIIDIQSIFVSSLEIEDIVQYWYKHPTIIS